MISSFIGLSSSSHLGVYQLDALDAFLNNNIIKITLTFKILSLDSSVRARKKF